MKKLCAFLLALCLLCGAAVLAEGKMHETPVGAIALPAEATLIQEQYNENVFNGVNNMDLSSIWSAKSGGWQKVQLTITVNI